MFSYSVLFLKTISQSHIMKYALKISIFYTRKLKNSKYDLLMHNIQLSISNDKNTFADHSSI